MKPCKETDQIVINEVLKIPSKTEENKFPYYYFDEEDESFVLTNKAGKLFFNPSLDMSSAWMVVKMMSQVMKDNPNFKWQGPVFNPKAGLRAPFGGEFEKEGWYIFIMYMGRPLVILDDSPEMAICKGGLCVRELSDFFAKFMK